MKRNLAIAALACGCALPLLALESQGELRTTLARLERALQHLAPLEERARQGDASVIADVLACTEGPLENPQAAEERLVSLRHELAQLQAELDEPAAVAAPANEDGAQEAWLAPLAGLDDAERRELALKPRRPAESAPVQAREPSAFEAPEYTADAVRLARLHYRQGMYREALALLDGREADPPAAYWKARCLEKLGDVAAARALYEQLVTTGGESFEAQRAREDLQFLGWRERFDANAKRAGGKL